MATCSNDSLWCGCAEVVCADHVPWHGKLIRAMERIPPRRVKAPYSDDIMDAWNFTLRSLAQMDEETP